MGDGREMKGHNEDLVWMRRDFLTCSFHPAMWL